MPGRDDYDPTLVTALFMPLFFGLMIGDAGYGVALIGIAWILGRYFKTPLAALARTFLTWGGAWSIGFGLLLFGEVFGFSLQGAQGWYPYLNRQGDPFLLFALAVIVGATHVNIGLLVGFRALRMRAGLRVAFLRKISWIILENGVFVLILGLLGIALADLWYVGVGVIAFATALLAWGGGVTDIVEVPSFVSNILSYLRLAVVGIAKSALAASVNVIIVGSLFPLGPGGWIAGGLLLVVAHGFILLLAVVTVGIQSVRLHYAEFYSKFYPSEYTRVVEKFHPSVKAGASGSR
jgi:V/A-type H+-transporting ATPase subunit I